MSAASKKTSARKSSSSRKHAHRSEKIVAVAAQPRRKGTKAYKFYAEMAKFVGRRKVDVETVLAETNYRRVDLNWDVARGFVKVA